MNLNDLNTELVKEILNALDGINYGSVEIVVQDGQVTQISTRNIKKTKIISRSKVKNQINL